MRIYLQFPANDGKTPRFCHLILQEDLLQGWNLIKEQGNQGRSGRIHTQHFEQRDKAIEALSQAKDSAIKKGFQIVFAEGDSL